jgi:hypothetical protein
MSGDDLLNMPGPGAGCHVVQEEDEEYDEVSDTHSDYENSS